MLKLKRQYFGHLMRRADSLEKTLMLGNTEGGRSGRQRMGWLDGITSSMDVSLSELWKIVREREAGCAAAHRVTKRWTRLSNGTTSSRGCLRTETQMGHGQVPCTHGTKMRVDEQTCERPCVPGKAGR